ncbi:MAG: hypothetical protein RIC29_07120 [Rhodospirillaceae bacterium]
MTHIPLYWPPDRPEFGAPVTEDHSKFEKSMGTAVDNQTTRCDSALSDLISLSIALNYFSEAEGIANGQTPYRRMRKPISAERASTQPWRTAVDSALAERSCDGDSSTPSR